MPARRRRPLGSKALRLQDPHDGGTVENADAVDILLYGPGGMAGLLLDLDESFGFASWEEARATWFANRELLMSLTTEDPARADFAYLAGTRPWAWWSFEAQLPEEELRDPGRFRPGVLEEWQLAYLQEHELLEPGELEAVERVGARLAVWQRNADEKKRPPWPKLEVTR